MRQFKYFVALILVVCFVALMSILLFGGHSSNKTNNSAKTQTSIASAARSGSTASLVIDGPINSATDHQQMRIDVDSSDVIFTMFSGYDDTVTTQKTFPNSVDSYQAFLGALTQANFTNGIEGKSATQLTSQCPLGERYQFIVTNSDGDETQNFWDTSCGGRGETYAGNTQGTITLFEAQVPDFDDLSEGFNY